MAQLKTVTNYAEIQENEIDALRSIYMDDFNEEEVKVGAWNVSILHDICNKHRRWEVSISDLVIWAQCSGPTLIYEQ